MLADLEAMAARDERRAARAARKRAAEPAPQPHRSPRSEAARRGWITRRNNAARRHRVTYKANDAEEEAGDFAYALYDKAHPLHGEHEIIEEWHNRLKPFYGRKVKLSVNGYRTNPDTMERHRIYIQRVGLLSTYADMFGPGSLYARALKVVRNIASKDELVVTSITIELADAEDGDAELFGEEADAANTED